MSGRSPVPRPWWRYAWKEGRSMVIMSPTLIAEVVTTCFWPNPWLIVLCVAAAAVMAAYFTLSYFVYMSVCRAEDSMNESIEKLTCHLTELGVPLHEQDQFFTALDSGDMATAARITLKYAPRS